MRLPDRRVLIGAVILVAAFLLIVAGFTLSFNVDRHRPFIEALASKALGVAFTIRGQASVRWLPRPRVTLRDVHLVRDDHEILAAEEFQMVPRWTPLLLHRRLSVAQVSLLTPTIRIQKRSDGAVNEDTPVEADTVKGKLFSRSGRVRLISVQHGTVIYLGQKSDTSATLSNLDLRLVDISWAQRTGRRWPDLFKSLSLQGTVRAESLTIGALSVSGLRAEVRGESGLVQLDSTQVTLWGGTSSGHLTLNFRDSLPRIQLVQAASQIELNQLFPVQIFSGTVEASLDVEGTGKDPKAIIQATTGRVSIRSEHLSLSSLDIDKLISDYNKTQNFSLIDLGSLLVAGPFAPLLTKGLDFSRLRFFGQMGHGRSELRKVVSDWRLADGVATTEDVAFTTTKNTVAFRGGLDLVNRSYRDFFVATVDSRGCAKVKQEITGLFAQPHAKGAASRSFLGMFKAAVRGARRLVSADKCDLFYSGSALQ